MAARGPGFRRRRTGPQPSVEGSLAGLSADQGAPPAGTGRAGPSPAQLRPLPGLAPTGPPGRPPLSPDLQQDAPELAAPGLRRLSAEPAGAGLRSGAEPGFHRAQLLHSQIGRAHV